MAIIRWFYAEAKGNIGPYHINLVTEVPGQADDVVFPEAKEYSAVLALLQDPRSAFYDAGTKLFTTDPAGGPVPPASANTPTFLINWYLLYWNANTHTGAIVLHGGGQTAVLDNLLPNPFIAYVLTLQTGQSAFWRNQTITTSRGAVP